MSNLTRRNFIGGAAVMAGGLTGLQKIVGNLSVTVTLTAQTLAITGRIAGELTFNRHSHEH